uniref:Uncharacterized protein n=1 Tax=Lepeophtheirus salmonis TaxID=72036 RepID=A0A0K2T525_LEPSM
MKRRRPSFYWNFRLLQLYSFPHTLQKLSFDYLPESSQWLVALQHNASSSDTSWNIRKRKFLLLPNIIIMLMLVRQSMNNG